LILMKKKPSFFNNFSINHKLNAKTPQKKHPHPDFFHNQRRPWLGCPPSPTSDHV